MKIKIRKDSNLLNMENLKVLKIGQKLFDKLNDRYVEFSKEKLEILHLNDHYFSWKYHGDEIKSFDNFFRVTEKSRGVKNRNP